MTEKDKEDVAWLRCEADRRDRFAKNSKWENEINLITRFVRGMAEEIERGERGQQRYECRETKLVFVLRYFTFGGGVSLLQEENSSPKRLKRFPGFERFMHGYTRLPDLPASLLPTKFDGVDAKLFHSSLQLLFRDLGVDNLADAQVRIRELKEREVLPEAE